MQSFVHKWLKYLNYLIFRSAEKVSKSEKLVHANFNFLEINYINHVNWISNNTICLKEYNVQNPSILGSQRLRSGKTMININTTSMAMYNRNIGRSIF